MADSTTEIDLDSVIDRLLEGELARYLCFWASTSDLGYTTWDQQDVGEG
jgi:hypothetical protein